MFHFPCVPTVNVIHQITDIKHSNWFANYSIFKLTEMDSTLQLNLICDLVCQTMFHFPTVTRRPIPLTFKINQRDVHLTNNSFLSGFSPQKFSWPCLRLRLCFCLHFWFTKLSVRVRLSRSFEVTFVSWLAQSLCFARTCDLSNWIQSAQGSFPFPLYWTISCQCHLSHLLGALPFGNLSPSLTKRISLKEMKNSFKIRLQALRLMWRTGKRTI